MKHIFFVVGLFVALGFGILLGCTAKDASATAPTAAPCPTQETVTATPNTTRRAADFYATIEAKADLPATPTPLANKDVATPETAKLKSLLDRFDTLNLILAHQFEQVDWSPQTLTLPPWHNRTVEDIELLSALNVRLRAAGAPKEAIEQIDKALPLLRTGVDDINLASLNAGREALAEATRLLGRQPPAP